MQSGGEVHVALLTPAGPAGGLDETALAGHVSWLAEAGVDALFVAGTTGEGPLLEDVDVARAVTCAVAAAGDGVRVVAQVGRPATAATIRLARMAVDAGASAVAAVVPYFFALDDDQLLRHFASVSEALAPVPLIVYNIPARTGNDVTAGLLDRLFGHGVAGLKDSTKSFERHLKYLEVAARHDGRHIYMGSDSLALDALQSGASGVTSAVANVMPELVVGLRDAVAAGELEKARKLQGEISALRAETQRERPLVVLKRRLGRRLEETGRGYPTAVRLPLG